jgi:hypothetical protein
VVLGFFQAILDGFVVFVVNSVLGGLLFLLFRSYLRRRISEWLEDELSGYIREQLAFTLQHADETAKTLAPLINAIIKEVAKDFQRGQSEGMVKIPFLGKVPPQLVQLFLERFLGGSKSKSNEGGNPFA